MREFRKTDPDTPVVLMGYANPIERIGQTEFIRCAKEAGADGAIVVDYPPEECAAFATDMRDNGLDLIFLLAPTSTTERVTQVAQYGGGFSYYVSLKGVTGAGTIDTADVARRVAAIREHVKLPIGVGFGIRDGATAQSRRRSGRRGRDRQPHHPGNRKQPARPGRRRRPHLHRHHPHRPRRLSELAAHARCGWRQSSTARR